jgi:hypothetical protein
MPIIERPDPIAQFWANLATAESQKQKEEHDKDLAARKKRQKNTAIIGTAIATAATAGLAAPALGLAGAPAVAGVGEAGSLLAGPVGAAGAAGAGTAATTGLLGTGGVVGLGGLLSAGAVGAQLGSQLAGEDYAGAIGTAAGAVNTIEQARRDQQIYGYQPTREGRATAAALAAKAGTTIDQVANLARQRGVSFDQALADVQGAASDREIEQEFFQQRARYAARYGGASDLYALDDDLNNLGPMYAPEPDDAKLATVQDGHQSIKDDIAAGNILPYEASSIAKQLRYDFAQSRMGRGKRQLPPNIGVDPQTGARTKTPWGKPYYEDETTLMVPRRDARGQINYFPKTITPGAPKNPQEAAKRMTAAGILPEEQKHYAWDGNSFTRKKIEVDPETKFNQDLIGEAIKKSDDPGMVAQYVRAGQQARQLPKFEVMVDEQIAKIGTGTLTMDDYARLRKQAQAYFPAIETDPSLADLKDRLTAIGNDAAQNAARAAAVLQAEQPAQAVPPPGSAASAEGPEGAGHAVGQAVRKIPGAVAAVPVAAAVGTAKAGKGIGEFGVGFAEGLFGIEKSDTSPQAQQARRFAVIQKQNIEAGIDQPISVIRPDGSAVQVIKGTLTAQKIAELEAAGFTIPGIGGG